MECSMFFLLLLLPPISTLPVTLFPYTTHCRSGLASAHPVPRRNRGRSMATFDDQPSPVAWGWVRLSTVRRGSVVISRLTGVTEKPSLDDWRALASKDLKGADPDTLDWETPEGLSVNPLTTATDVATADHDTEQD